MQAATTITTDINDWTVTDLYGSSRNLGGSLANNSAALDGAVSGGHPSRLTTRAPVTTQYSPAVMQHLAELKQKQEEEETGIVTVEELGQAADETDATDKADSKSN